MIEGQDTIKLFRDGGCWMAETTGPGSARLIELFGTACLPTPYLAGSDALLVAAEIEHHNPTAQVVIVHRHVDMAA